MHPLEYSLLYLLLDNTQSRLLFNNDENWPSLLSYLSLDHLNGLMNINSLMNMKQWVGFCQRQLVSDKRYLEAEHAEWIQLWIRLKTEAQGIVTSSFDFYKTNSELKTGGVGGGFVNSLLYDYIQNPSFIQSALPSDLYFHSPLTRMRFVLIFWPNYSNDIHPSASGQGPALEVLKTTCHDVGRTRGWSVDTEFGGLVVDSRGIELIH